MRYQSIKNIEKEFLEPSFQYLVENGLENTSVRDLCKAMNISYGSLYYWFSGKDDIYTSVVEYGLGKAVKKLFSSVYEKFADLELFFSTFLDDVDKCTEDIRVVFQFATSIDYGNVVRNKMQEFNGMYREYAEELSEKVGASVEDMAPFIYLLISVVSDYVIWQDRPATEMQMKFLYKGMTPLRK